MAGESLSYTELKNWYDTFNTVISNYGGDIEQLIVPTQDKAKPNDINNLLNKITELANEEYLSTQPTLYDTDYTITSKGEKIVRSTAATPISNTATNILSIKCRNKIQFSSGTCSSGKYSNGSFSSGVWGNVGKSNGTKSNGQNTNAGKTSACSNGTNSSGYNSYITRTNESNSHGTKTCGVCNSGTIADILNANTSY